MTKKFAKATIATTTACLLAGCGGFPRNEPGNGFGQITLSSPRIEGRERLINERREQEKWLRGRLEMLADKDFGLSGEVELRSLAVTAFQAGVNVDPNLKLDKLNRGRQATQVEQAADDERTLAAFRTSMRDQILADFYAKKITDAEASDRLKKLGYDLTVPKPSMAASAASGSASGGATLPTTKVSANKDSTVVPPGDSPRRTGLSSTPMEVFQDVLAARQVIRNEINDVRLDDLHDLQGRTLYRLTLNAEVLPHDDTSAWAVARLRVKLPKLSDDDYSALLERAKLYQARRLDAAADTLQRELTDRLASLCWGRSASQAMAAKDWGSAENERVFRRAMRCATSEVSREARAALERLLSTGELPRLAHPEPDAGLKLASGQAAGQTPTWLKRSILLHEMFMLPRTPTEPGEDYERRRVLSTRWAVWLGDIIRRYRAELENDSPLACLKESAALRKGCGYPLANAPANELDRFKHLLNASLSASVYSVTPKETVQRLSEVSSNRKVTEFLASLTAVTGSAGLAAGLQSTRAYDAFYTALRRQPLVVGITESSVVCPQAGCSKELVFGWVLGPSFELSNDGKSTRFRHTVVQRSVSAEIVLPSWLDRVEIEPETFWVRESGERVAASSNCAPGEPLGCGSTPRKHVIALDGRASGALQAIDVRGLRVPRVDNYQYLDVTVGKPASVMITGANVWRSTEVLIGAQRADAIAVLPDNAGLVATFDRITAPLGSDTPRRGNVLLTLFTSEGHVDAGRVEVHTESDKPPAVETAPQSAKGMPPRVVAGVEQGFELTNPLKASDTAVVRIRSKKDVALRVVLDKTSQLNEARNRVAFTLAAANVPNLKKGDPVTVELLVTKPSGATEIVSVLETGTYYEKDTDLEATAAVSRAKPDQPFKVNLTLPPGSIDGFTSLAGGTATLVLTLKFEGAEEPEVMESKCTIEAKKPLACEAIFEPRGVVKAVLSKLKNVEVKPTVSLKGDDTPRLKLEEWTVKP